MKTMQRRLDYASSASGEDASYAVPAVSQATVRQGPVTWSIRGVYLTAWAVVGIVLWVPTLLGAVLFYSVSLVQSTLMGTSRTKADRHLRSAADFYRGFVGAMETVRTPGDEDPVQTEDHPAIGPRTILPEIGWAILVWYVVLWSAGIVEATPVDLASSLAAAP
jgi:hypothetical protein